VSCIHRQQLCRFKIAKVRAEGEACYRVAPHDGDVRKQPHLSKICESINKGSADLMPPSKHTLVSLEKFALRTMRVLSRRTSREGEGVEQAAADCVNDDCLAVLTSFCPKHAKSINQGAGMDGSPPHFMGRDGIDIMLSLLAAALKHGFGVGTLAPVPPVFHQQGGVGSQRRDVVSSKFV
jgi:hypothetical protein